MNVQNLITLLADVKKNAHVFFEIGINKILGITSLKYDHTHCVNLLTKNTANGLKVWELVILLQKLPNDTLIYVLDHQKSHQIFGLRFDDGKVYLK
ncbi:hypothetical protein [Bombilactobacillus thymidiniphilus]|uniref:Uncharacterized protein n=1 Tax=Bombilactobacillus thymidiniphilus TaxID=2923363 RepID=A0ABY4PBX0_9LACO|nr:hypothetical protein [Bombilactobacillus thymidiniphilus]UQS83254.1 hypothetical protein MOO47_05620 [Bombilactobacillus thymidiniphilus]